MAESWMEDCKSARCHLPSAIFALQSSPPRNQPVGMLPQGSVQRLQVAEVLPRICEPMGVVLPRADRLEVGPEAFEPTGDLHRVVNQQPALGISGLLRRLAVVAGQDGVAFEQLRQGDPPS